MGNSEQIILEKYKKKLCKKWFISLSPHLNISWQGDFSNVFLTDDTFCDWRILVGSGSDDEDGVNDDKDGHHDDGASDDNDDRMVIMMMIV